MLGAVCLLFWTGIYFLVSLQQSHAAAPDPGRQQLLDSRGREMERALEEAQRQMKAQVRTNTALLTKLRRLRSEIGLNQARVVNSLFVDGIEFLASWETYLISWHDCVVEFCCERLCCSFADIFRNINMGEAVKLC